jgi:prophage regulatory protein
MANDKFIRLPAVIELIGIQKTKVYALVKNREFPAPLKVGASSVWSEAEIFEWMQAQKAA